MDSELVVKVGGSLYDLTQLGKRLRSWLDAQASKHILLVPGGHTAADLVRQAHTLDAIDEERCHWLALRSLSFTAYLLAARVPDAVVIEELSQRFAVWESGQTPILDMHAFALADETNPGHLPHSWAVTSDSLAVRVAMLACASRLVLLKSCDGPLASCDWGEAARLGIVDAAFPELMASVSAQIQVRLVNFRRWLAGATGPHGPNRAP